MLIPIIGRSAIEFWLGPGAAIFSNYSSNQHRNLMTFPEKFEFQVSAEKGRIICNLLNLNLPLETFSFSHSNHWCGKATHVLTRSQKLPPESFIEVSVSGMQLAIERPEFCFVRAAKNMDMAHLVNLGMQLCALYYIQPEIKAELKKQNGRGTSRRDRNPLTTAKQIKEFMETVNGEYGIKLARKAVKYIIDESNSPVESALATIMFLPAKYGGYGMPRFTMNEPVKLSDFAAEYFGYDTLRGDFLWKDKKIIAEYNSKAFHMDPQQQMKDANRMNALQQSGYRVVPITYNNLKNFNNIENQMSYLMKELNCPELGEELAEYKSIRKKLCHDLFGTEQNYYDIF